MPPGARQREAGLAPPKLAEGERRRDFFDIISPGVSDHSNPDGWRGWRVPEPLEEHAWHGNQPADSTDLATDADIDLRTLDDPKP